MRGAAPFWRCPLRFALTGRCDSGCGLVDALVATGLLGIALLPLAYIQSTGTRSGVASYEVVAASALAMDLVEKVATIPYADARLAPTSGYVAPDPTLSATNPVAADGTNWSACGPWNPGDTPRCGFVRTLKITADTPLAHTKQIDVQVSWTEFGVDHAVTLSTIKAVGS